ncbi:multidrug ABC transporter ATP-binding protein [Alloscardovia macacae]|uniref:Multidrug ABC transporter ATP-binding protein n=1 Tax=Alloscardovia macacae TaxID=1160091 RepID=A0A1Y2T3N6_9BIFI|nr:ABC transporter ATP-binding protein [Alloscardovia macacae]OTA25490.1 multidrug ABC transporter ATP-binding protein [Alloscardovia macacae]OTA30133.1 multidrug ABC transporter ATP-binding protein [Alloscardovia macacae]
MLSLWRKYLSRHWVETTLLVAVQIIQTVLNLYLPNLQADIINDGVTAGDADKVWSIGWTMMAVAAIQIIANIIAVYYSTHVAMRMGYEIRKDYFASVEGLSLNEIETFSAGSLITRATNDVQQVQQATMQSMLIILQALIMFLGGIIMAARQDGPLTWSFAIIVPLVLVVVGAIMSQLGPLFGKLQKKLDSVNKLVREQISGVRVIRAFVREDTERARFDESNKDLYSIVLNIGRWIGVAIPSMFFIINVSTVAIMWFGGHRIESGEMGIGSLQAFIQYLLIMLMGLMMATMMSVMLPRASVSAKRINEVLEATSSISAPEHPFVNEHPQGVLEFRHVSFSYPGAEEPVLKDVSFTARPGQTTAFISATGSGKSTIIRLASRMFDVTSGEVLVDGHNVKEYDPAALAQLFAPVPQKSVLFAGTIRSNLLYGNSSATDTDLWHALEVAQAADFVRELPDGLDSHVAQGGTNFSGGQKQRLSIARAIVRKPFIYSFDDSFSALDMATDAKLRAALAPITQNATQLLVAQRASSIRHAENIIVMDNGKIDAMGTHDELMATNDTYREIVESQGGQGPDIESLSIDAEKEA